MSKPPFTIVIGQKNWDRTELEELARSVANAGDLIDEAQTWLLKRVEAVEEDTAQAPPASPPPREPKLLLRYVLPRKYQEHIIGDLEEVYRTEWLPEHGPRHARRLYWWHAIRSITPMLWTAIKSSSIITLILGAADWLRDRLS